MKRVILVFMLIACSAGSVLCQWKNFELWNPLVFGVHDTTLFASLTTSGTYWHAHNTSSNWTKVDSFPQNYTPRSFGSIGSYVLATAYRSSDNGSHWIVTKARDAANCFLTVGPNVYFGGKDVWRSTDSGMNWTASQAGIKGYVITSLASANAILFAGTPSGVFRSTDNGQSWQTTSVTSYIYSLTSIGSTVLVGLKNGGIYRSKDGGENWSHDVKGLTNGYVNGLVNDGKNVFAATQGSGVFVSTDSGDSWDTVNAGLMDPWDNTMLNMSTICVFDTLLVAGALTNDGQLNWTFVRPISEMVPPKSAVAEQPVLNSDSIAIYPNPTANNITVRLGTSIARRIEVLNVLGVSLQTIAPRESEVTIDLSNLPSGTYFILVESSKGVICRKIVRE